MQPRQQIIHLKGAEISDMYGYILNLAYDPTRSEAGKSIDAIKQGHSYVADVKWRICIQHRRYTKLCGGALYFVHVGNFSLAADLSLKVVLDSSKHIEKIAHNPWH